ncbi:MAG TPA: hypothetical protein ENK57_05735 [Polyangiaceae bacterium]|nr:hypothetical protein [Polyangiaceae bacterium]
MRIYQVVVLAVVLGTAAPIALHHQEHGVLNPHQMGLAFFLWLNAIIAFWEICLFFRIDLIEEQYAEFKEAYRGRELDRVKDFFSSKVALGGILSLTTWAEIWSSYAVFDESYADRKSYGFFIDVGNGFSTLVPSLVCTYGMTFHVLPPRAFGILTILLCYQMWYGTLVYFGSFLKNRRYRGHRLSNLALFVGLSNGIWFTFPLWGMWAAIRLIYDNGYAVFLTG